MIPAKSNKRVLLLPSTQSNLSRESHHIAKKPLPNQYQLTYLHGSSWSEAFLPDSNFPLADPVDCDYSVVVVDVVDNECCCVQY
mmetsp:Transcript_5131/g.10498  ORF Transcript_5131/g.10498 Transcript_5131/m.10498 type:complete len:84 (-) Transcript_5131:1593-1844(-)